MLKDAMLPSRLFSLPLSVRYVQTHTLTHTHAHPVAIMAISKPTQLVFPAC